MDEILQAANTEEVANPQIDTQEVTETTEQVTAEPVQEEVTQPQQQQDITQTQAFSRRLKEEAQKAAQAAVDAEYERLYGEEYGIHSKADYDSYLERQRLLQDGKDPELYQRLNSLERENQEFKKEKAFIEQDHLLESDPDYSDFYKPWKSEIHQIAKEKGVDLQAAFIFKCFSELPKLKSTLTQQGEQAAIQKITQNRTSSPGALGESAENAPVDIWSMSDKEFKAFQEKALNGELKKR